MRVLEWLVLLPLWRRVISNPSWHVPAAVGTGIAWVLIIIIIAVATAGGDDEGGEAVMGEPTVTAAAEPEVTEEPTEIPEATPEPPPEPTATPEPTPPPESERIVPAVPGAVAEAEGVQITLNEIIDPWISTAEFAFDEPSPGNRFVAMDITIQYVKDSGTHFACDINFRLTDAEAFAYDAAFLIDLEPSLKCIDLGGGQKTRGWMGFEIGEGAILDLLKYDPDIFTTNDIEFQFQ